VNDRNRLSADGSDHSVWKNSLQNAGQALDYHLAIELWQLNPAELYSRHFLLQNQSVSNDSWVLSLEGR
jgi:hypothetical protein